MRISYYHGNECTLEFEATSFEDMDLLLMFYVKWTRSDSDGKKRMLKKLKEGL